MGDFNCGTKRGLKCNAAPKAVRNSRITLRSLYSVLERV